MKSLIRCLALSLALASAAPAAAQTKVLVTGDPALTEEMVGRFTEFFAWAFDVQLTNDQCDVLRKWTIDSWQQHRKSDIDSVVQLVGQQVEIAKLDAAKRSFIHAQIEPQLLEEMRQQPDEPMARWALSVYEASHKVLVAGTPPLTRQSADAFLEGLFFIVGEVAGRRTVPDEQLKKDWAAALAANYPRMPQEMKQQIAAMPLFVATMRLAWPALAEPEKAKFRSEWAGQVQALMPPASQPVATEAGKKSVAEMMAEQNARHQMFMNMSSAMMGIHQMNFNTISNFSGGPYRYMK
jgi:hypothetical protein